jgi:hypothetical protein
MPSVFLSHNSKDKAFTRKLAERLKEAGIDIWIDEAELNVGDSLLEKIGTALDKANFVAAVLSHNSIQSSWVQLELKLAMTKELAERKVRVLPILIEKCEIPEFLKDKIYADFSDPRDFDAPFASLLRALGVNRQLRDIAPLAVPPAQPNKPKIASQNAENTLQPNKGGLVEFVDIALIDVDKERTYNPDPQKLLYNVYFKLSSYPPAEWVEIFDAERRFPRHTMWRKAWIEGNSAVVYCVPDEVKQFHLHDIKQDIETSNKKYREYLHRRATRQIAEENRKQAEKQAISEALDDLDF